MGKETWEFRVLNGYDHEVQMKINQWKHKYILKIYNCVSIDSNLSKIYISRTEKSKEVIPDLEEA